MEFAIEVAAEIIHKKEEKKHRKHSCQKCEKTIVRNNQCVKDSNEQKRKHSFQFNNWRKNSAASDPNRQSTVSNLKQSAMSDLKQSAVSDLTEYQDGRCHCEDIKLQLEVGKESAVMRSPVKDRRMSRRGSVAERNETERKLVKETLKVIVQDSCCDILL